jgi:CDP-glycerol glycerophosphotransferase (TagB/SpsB family)
MEEIVMINKIINRLKYWGQLLLLPFYWLSFFVPRNKKIWLFGSTFGRRFADNPRYAYLYMKQYHNSEIHSIWISHNRNVVKFLNQNGYEAYYYHSIKGIVYCLRAGVYIYDNYSKDINFWQSGGAVKVNLWHGTATKKIQKDNVFDYYRNPRNRLEWFKGIPRRISDEKKTDYILATSKNMAPILAGAFGTDMNHVLTVGHPRNDVLLGDKIKDIYTSDESECISKLKVLKEQNKKLIFYVPTFRNSETKFFDIMNLFDMNEFLKKNSLVWCNKLHIKSKLKHEFEKIEYSNFFNIDADIDPATILPYCDLMIADYSSIYLDYTFLEKPAIAFPFDYEEYLSDSRECYFEYNQYMPEIKVHNMLELQKSILDTLKSDVCGEKRKERRRFHFDDVDSNSSERLYRSIVDIIAKRRFNHDK